MTTLSDYRSFIKAFPRHQHQQGALHAYEQALLEVSADDLLTAARSFAAEVLADRPNGPRWKFCMGPVRWLQEQRFKAYLQSETADEAAPAPVTTYTFRSKAHTWDAGKPTQVVGIMLYIGRSWTFVTPEQARTAADALHDLADQQEEARNGAATS